MSPKLSSLRNRKKRLGRMAKIQQKCTEGEPPQEENSCLKGGAGGGGEGEAKEEVSERRASLKHMKEEVEGKKRWRCWWMWEEIITSIL